jgi:hypothetical protein
MLIGCDFSSRPTRRKPIVVARGHPGRGQALCLDALQTFDTLDGFADWLARPLSWVGGFDLPFGLPRELVETLDWPRQWEPCIRPFRGFGPPRCSCPLQGLLRCAAGGRQVRPPRDRSACRLQPVDEMGEPAGGLHAACRCAAAAGCRRSPAGRAVAAGGARQRVALEAYPGLLAREVLGMRSYKSDDRARQTPERLIARKDLVQRWSRAAPAWACACS